MTKRIMVGSVPVGGGAPVSIQSMLNTRTTDVEGSLAQLDALADCEKPLTVAVMGCIVNGPGEAREADIGIAGGEDCGVLFVRGEQKMRLPYDELLPELLRQIEQL